MAQPVRRRRPVVADGRAGDRLPATAALAAG